MAHGKPRDSQKERQWRQTIREWQRSGLSVRVFCARRGLAQPSLYAWRRELAKGAKGFTPPDIPPPGPEEAGRQGGHTGG
jgi:hypothetical protein